jgi:dolichol-phosphate mannosyltransferase
MRVLVTGAGGFVGRNLAGRLVSEGHDVHVLLRPGARAWRLEGLECRRHVADIADADRVDALWKRLRPEWVFNCAAHGAYSFETDLVAMARANVVGTAALLRAVGRHGCEAFVHSGSSSEYGDCDHAPVEDEMPVPNSDYAITKAAATALCERAAREHCLPVSVLRLYSVYGPWEDPRRLIPTLCVAATKHQLPPLAAPWTVRDFVFIDDVVDAYLRVAATPAAAGRVFNIGTGRQTSLAGLVDIARDLFQVHEVPKWGGYEQRAWDTRVWVANPARANAELGWYATRSLRDGLQATARWFLANGRRIIEASAGQQAGEQQHRRADRSEHEPRHPTERRLPQRSAEEQRLRTTRRGVQVRVAPPVHR